MGCGFKIGRVVFGRNEKPKSGLLHRYRGINYRKHIDALVEKVFAKLGGIDTLSAWPGRSGVATVAE